MHTKTRELVTLGLLIALNIILARVIPPVYTQNIRVDFAFITVLIAAALYGPLPAMAVGGLSDLLGAILLPKGAYFPGFTISEMLVGLIYGFFLYRVTTPKETFFRTALGAFFAALVYLFLTTYWLAVINAGAGFLDVFTPWRIGEDLWQKYVALLPMRGVKVVVSYLLTIIIGPLLLPRLVTWVRKRQG